MKIAFFSKCLPSDKPNGVSVQVHRLAQELARQGHAVTCFSCSPPPQDALYKVHRINGKSTSRLLNKFAPAIAFSRISGRDFDILHFHGDDYLRCGSRKRVRTFYGSALQEAMHAHQVSRFCYQILFYAFEWISTMKAGKLAAISRDTFRYLPNVKVHIPCCVPLKSYKPGEKSPVPTLLFIGDLDSRKNGRLLVKIFEQEILKSHESCMLRIIGPQSCTGRNIQYLGQVDEFQLIREYQQAWVYCMVSSYEGFGVPAIEAMACGTAVAAINNPGVREIIVHDKNGLLCTRESFGSSTTKLLNDLSLRNRLVSEGLQTAVEYDSAVIAKRYEQLYRQIEDSSAD